MNPLDAVEILAQIKADMNDIYALGDNAKSPGGIRDFVDALHDYSGRIDAVASELENLARDMEEGYADYFRD